MKILLFATVLAIGLCFYSANSGVVSLTDKNFREKVINSDEIWLVEFYAPWCGHCKQLKPEWEKAAKALKGVVKVGAVDADQYKQLGGQYGVQGFPTIKLFGASKAKPEDYQSGRDAASIVDFAMKKASALVKKRLSGKGGDSGSKQKKSGGDKKRKSSGGKDEVVVLTADNFKETVLESKDIWFVEFYAPWCGHCKKLEPEWKEAASKLKGVVKLGKVDATEEQALAGQYGV